jgi:hypothetical protein
MIWRRSAELYRLVYLKRQVLLASGKTGDRLVRG